MPHSKTSGFDSLKINPKILDVLHQKKFSTPTPIQAAAIPIAASGRDVIGIAQTGTGKTLAFGIPLLSRLTEGPGTAVILAPTRELALQIDESLAPLGRALGLSATVVIGGANMETQRRALSRHPRVIIATPGRLIDLMQQRSVSMAQVSILVLDEADRMLDMGFMPQIKQILSAMPSERQTLLFSATMPPEIEAITRQQMKNPERVSVAVAGEANKLIEQQLYCVEAQRKIPLLAHILNEWTGSVLVFCRTKYSAKKLCNQIQFQGHPAAEIHGNRSLAQRRDALEGFKRGKYRVLIATDIAARGIDVTGIQLVVNFDLPSTPEDYVHRIGRTGRATLAGHAISFAAPDQKREVMAIERLTRTHLPLTPLPELAYVPPAPPPAEEVVRHGRGGGRDSGRSERPAPRYASAPHAPRAPHAYAPREREQSAPPRRMHSGERPGGGGGRSGAPRPGGRPGSARPAPRHGGGGGKQRPSRARDTGGSGGMPSPYGEY